MNVFELFPGDNNLAKKLAQVKEDSWHGEGDAWGGQDPWTSDQHEMVEGATVSYVVTYFDTKTGDKGESTVSALTRNDAADKIVGLMHERGYDVTVTGVRAAVEEGWQDFNKVEPYEVCLAGKPVKTFDYYEDARRFHDNWKKKLYREGNKEKADKITLNPIMKEEGVAESKEAVFKDHKIEVEYPEGRGHSHIYHRREPYRLSTIFSDANSVAARNRRAKISLFVDGEYIPNYEWQEGVDAPNGGIAEDTGSWIVYDPKTKQIKKRFKTHTAGKSYAKAHSLGFASSEYYFDNVKEKAVAEDFSNSPVAGAITRRILQQRLDLLKQYGPELVGAAVDNVADYVGDVDEIGSSDVSGWVIEVERMLKDNPPEAFAEAQTDYSKRRQRERDIDAGKPVAKQRQSKMTDYQKRRAQDKKNMEFGEGKTRLDPKCWKGKKIGNPKTKMKGGVRVNNCVPAESIEEDWQKVNKKDKTDGMSKKAVNAYKREHPGSKLQTAVTTKPSKLKKGSKASKRRSSYCSRSKGQMKMHSISCQKTPDKAICKARRRWNCEESYWNKLQDERNTLIDSLVNELKESIK